jgi:hypothetical protein
MKTAINKIGWSSEEPYSIFPVFFGGEVFLKIENQAGSQEDRRTTEKIS